MQLNNFNWQKSAGFSLFDFIKKCLLSSVYFLIVAFKHPLQGADTNPFVKLIVHGS